MTAGGIVITRLILPNLSQKHANASKAEFSATLDWALRLALIITVPAAIGLAIVLGIYQTFHTIDVEATDALRG